MISFFVRTFRLRMGWMHLSTSFYSYKPPVAKTVINFLNVYFSNLLYIYIRNRSILRRTYIYRPQHGPSTWLQSFNYLTLIQLVIKLCFMLTQSSYIPYILYRFCLPSGNTLGMVKIWMAENGIIRRTPNYIYRLCWKWRCPYGWRDVGFGWSSCCRTKDWKIWCRQARDKRTHSSGE